jgi:hypothetical protein
MHTIEAMIDMPFFGISKGDVVEVEVKGNKVASPSGLSWSVGQLRDEFKQKIWCESNNQPSDMTIPKITII